MRISIIVAAAENGVIGRDGKLPWHISADLRRFKKLTMGHTLLMGRHTWDAIGRPLPGRSSIVLSRNRDLRLPGAEVFDDFEAAVQTAAGRDESELFVAGGGEIYRLALPHAQRVYLTRVHKEVEGDVEFPPLDPSHWRLIWEEDGPDSSSPAYTFQIFQRRNRDQKETPEEVGRG